MSDLKRAYNFNPGPGALPLEVLQQAQAELLDFKGTGMSVMEISHRSKEFEAVIQTAEADLRDLLGIPSNYKVMFLQGGATLQFAMLAMNLRPAGASADYIVTGAWSKIALKEAKKLGTARAAANTEADGFNCIPASLDLDPKAAYLHFTANETIHGVEYFSEPTPPAGVPLGLRYFIRFHQPPDRCFKIRLTVCGRAEERGSLWRDRGHCPRRYAGAHARKSARDVGLQNSRRQRITAQHAAQLRHLHGGTGLPVGEETGRTGCHRKDQPHQGGTGVRCH